MRRAKTGSPYAAGGKENASTRSRPWVVTETAPNALLALSRGFQESRVLLAGAEPWLSTTLSKEASMVEIARERLSAVRFLEKVTLVAGDFQKKSLPPGGDLA